LLKLKNENLCFVLVFFCNYLKIVYHNYGYQSLRFSLIFLKNNYCTDIQCLYFFFSLFYCCGGWEYIVAFIKVLTISYLNVTPTILIHTSLFHPWIVSTDIIFSFIYMCTQYLHYIHYSSPFPHLLPLPTATIPPGSSC
jgi:hypothetical protein